MTIGGSGYGGYESPDGKTIVYQAADTDSPLLALPLAGGPARQLVGCVKGQAFAMAVSGVYYAPCNIGPESIVHLLEPASRSRPGARERHGPFRAGQSRCFG